MNKVLVKTIVVLAMLTTVAAAQEKGYRIRNYYFSWTVTASKTAELNILVADKGTVISLEEKDVTKGSIGMTLEQAESLRYLLEKAVERKTPIGHVGQEGPFVVRKQSVKLDTYGLEREEVIAIIDTRNAKASDFGVAGADNLEEEDFSIASIKLFVKEIPRLRRKVEYIEPRVKEMTNPK